MCRNYLLCSRDPLLNLINYISLFAFVCSAHFSDSITEMLKKFSTDVYSVSVFLLCQGINKLFDLSFCIQVRLFELFNVLVTCDVQRHSIDIFPDGPRCPPRRWEPTCAGHGLEHGSLYSDVYGSVPLYSFVLIQRTHSSGCPQHSRWTWICQGIYNPLKKCQNYNYMGTLYIHWYFFVFLHGCIVWYENVRTWWSLHSISS